MLLTYISNIDKINCSFVTSIGELVYNLLFCLLFLLFKYIELLSFILCVYTVFLIIKSFKSPIKEYPIIADKRKFLILIPAHNEETVISNILHNLTNNLNYRKDFIKIYVIADNCTDKTVDICKNMDIDVIIHNSKPEEPVGKPYGIQYALDKLSYKIDNYDYISIFDADNIVSDNFFKEINSQLEYNPKIKVVQGYLDCKNMDDTYISVGYSLSYYLTNRFFCYARNSLGLSPVIGGTGFAISVDTIKKLGWKLTSLTEDLELQMKCVLYDYKISWNHYAKVYDEKPIELEQSFVQRFRWARGHWSVKRQYFIPLIKKSMNTYLNTGKIDFTSLDSALYATMPLISAFTPVLFLYKLFTDNSNWLFNALLLFAFITIVYLILSLYAMRQDSAVKTKRNLFIILFGSMWYVITGMIIYSIGILTYNKNIWIRTKHSSLAKIEDILYKK